MAALSPRPLNLPSRQRDHEPLPRALPHAHLNPYPLRRLTLDLTIRAPRQRRALRDLRDDEFRQGVRRVPA